MTFSNLGAVIIYIEISSKFIIFENLCSANYPRCTKLPDIGNEPTFFRCAVRAAGAMQRAADIGRSHGGDMRKNRIVIIYTILALGAAGSIDASVTVSAKVAQPPVVHVVPGSSCASPRTYFL